MIKKQKAKSKEQIFLKYIIETALSEDIGSGDITTKYLIPEDVIGFGQIIFKEPAIVCGLQLIKQIYRMLDKSIEVKLLVKDGSKVKKNTVTAIIKGPLRSILSGERVALNFLQRLSGIATLTRKFVDACSSYPVKIYDTRKTTPGLRTLEKRAVRIGGGENHRMGLYDAILIKDNHLKAVSDLKSRIKVLRKQLGEKYFIEIEASNVKEAEYFANLDVDAIMLDNMSIKDISLAVEKIRAIAGKKKFIEVSGGVNLKNIHKIAKTGVDRISIGALTHSVKAIDISMEVSL